MEVRKAVITAAGKHQRTLPLQSLIDRDGVQKTALSIIIEEILSAGVDEICVVIMPGDKDAYQVAAGNHASRLHFVEQKKPLGYGDAVASAHSFVGNENCLLLVGDHLYVSHADHNCAHQLVTVAKSQSCAVSAVQATHESKLPFYGTIGGRLVTGMPGLYQIESVIEKPTPTEAEQKLAVPGLRAGNYLCFFGMHVLTPLVMEILSDAAREASPETPLHLTSALAQLTGRERYLAYEIRGRRYDIGVRYGLLAAQLALALDGQDRDEVLANLVELLALKKSAKHGG